MYRLGIIEESLNDLKVLDKIKQYFYSQRIENVPEDEYPIWHTNEYHVEDSEIQELSSYLQDKVKQTWYIHAFNDEKLYVVLCGKFFEISLCRDETWDEMIEYGVEYAQVEKKLFGEYTIAYLEKRGFNGRRIMDWEIKDYAELTKDELYKILKLRFQVFVGEQKCTDLDLDDKDQLSRHMFIRENEEMIACLRIIPAGISYKEASIGRFVVDEKFRKNGIGRRGIEKAIAYIFDEWKEPAIRISGQAYLRDFYCGLGFEIVKGPYMEDNIPHYELLLKKD